MKLLALEFCKCRRRKLTLVCAGLLAAQLLWFGAYLTQQDAEALAQGWMLLLYNLAMVDAIMLPIGVAVIASRSCELEHRGHTLKLLETAVTPGRLYAAKLAWGALVLAGLLLARGALFLALGLAMGFPGGTPWGRFVVFTALSWAVSSSRGCPSASPTRPWLWYAASSAASWDSWPCSSPCGYSGASPGGITACSLWCGWNGMRPPAGPLSFGGGRSPWIWPSCACGRPSFSLWDGLCSSERRCEAWYCAVSGRS